MKEQQHQAAKDEIKQRTGFYLTEYQVERIASAVAFKLARLVTEDVWEGKLKALEDKITQLSEAIAQPTAAKTILTQREAIAFVKMKSLGGLRSWMKRYAPNARVAHGRYSKARLDIGLAREAGGIRERN